VILKKCGISDKLAIIQYNQTQPGPVRDAFSPRSLSSDLLFMKPPLCKVAGLEPSAITQTISTFESSLLDLGTMNMPLVTKIEDSSLRSKARVAASQLISDSYALLYKAIHDPAVRKKSHYTPMYLTNPDN